VPIIMLSGHGERWRVVEAVRLGVHEYLVKPVSAKAIYDRLISIVMQPRPAVQLGDYYGPEPRKMMAEPLDDAPIVEDPARVASSEIAEDPAPIVPSEIAEPANVAEPVE